MISGLLRGLGVTFRTMFKRPLTIPYPEQRREVAERFRGRHVLRRYENGLERCIGCSLCSAACPADAILVVPGENTDERRYSPGERYAQVYEINMIRCIFCGFCAEACPTNAIVLEHEFELAQTVRSKMIYVKEDLLLPPADGAEATPQDTRGRDVPFRLGGMDYFRMPDELRAPDGRRVAGPVGLPDELGSLDEPASADESRVLGEPRPRGSSS